MKKLVLSIVLAFFNFNNFAYAETDAENFIGNVYMKGEFLDSDILKISVWGSDFSTPIIGFSFNLKYENEKLFFLKYEPGDFLEKGGDPFYLVQNKENSSKLFFGETLRRDDNFPLGEGVIATFYFQISEKMPFNFEFENGVASTLDLVRQDLDKVNFKDFSFPEEENSEVVYTSKNNFSVSSLTDSKNIFSDNAFLISLILFLSILTVFIIKKSLNKRQKISVNFK